MRLVFAGTPEVALPSLDLIVARGHEVAMVLTQPDAPGKRGKALIPSPVKVRAQELGLEVLTPAKASDPDVVATIKALGVDAAAVVAYGQILRQPLLDAAGAGWVNLHFSLLPAWRGAAPVQRSIAGGDDITGASTFLLERGLDSGPVLGTLTETIRRTDTAGDLLDRLAVAGAPLLVDSLEALVSGRAMPIPQSADGVSHAAKISREDAYVAWEMPSHVVDRVIRSCTPAPGAWTVLPDGSVAKLGPVSPRPGPSTTPGLVFVQDADVLVGTGTDPVALSWIQPAGKNQIPARDWYRGARLLEGAVLGGS